MPLDPDEKPTDETVQNDLAALTAIWDPSVEFIEQADAFYTRTNDIWAEMKKVPSLTLLASNRPQYHSGSGSGIIDHAVEAHTKPLPTWTRIPAGGEKTEADERIEAGLDAIVADSFLRLQYYPTLVNAKQLALYDYTSLFTGLDLAQLERPVRKDGEDKEDFEKREDAWAQANGTWNPIRLEVPQPGELLMDPTQKTGEVALLRKTFRAYELADLTSRMAERFGGKSYSMTGKDAYEPVKTVGRWAAAYFTLADEGGHIWYNQPNTWGFQPYSHTFSGAANMPHEAAKNGRGFDPQWYIRQSLLFPIMETLTMLDQIVVAQHQGLLRKMFARYIAKNAEEAAAMLQTPILEGAPDDWDIEKTPELPNQAAAHEAMLLRDIESNTISGLVSGQPDSRIDTATAYLMLSDRADRKFGPMVMQIEHLYNLAGSRILRLVKTLDSVYHMGPVQIGKHKLSAADIGKNYAVTCSLKPTDVVAFMQEKNDARQDRAAGGMSLDRFLEVSRVPNPQEERIKIEMDRAAAIDPVASEVGGLALKLAGLGSLADTIAAERKAAMVRPNGEPLFQGRPRPAPAERQVVTNGNGGMP